MTEFELGQVLSLKKAHPCGSSRWVVFRLGGDIGIKCLGCSRQLLVQRAALERRLTAISQSSEGAAL